MADVAQVAGVSHQTVSRVLSNHPNVRDSTRAEVLRAIEALGYRRNSSARALVTRHTLTLGVVACNPALFGPASTRSELEEAALNEGYMVTAVTLRRYTKKALADAIDHLGDWGVEGIVVIVPQREAVAALAELRLPFPLVTVARLGRALGALVFWIDKRHRQVALDNLTLCFGHEKSPEEIRAIAKENFRRIGENYCSAIKTAAMQPWQMYPHFDFQFARIML